MNKIILALSLILIFMSLFNCLSEGDIDLPIISIPHVIEPADNYDLEIYPNSTTDIVFKWETPIEDNIQTSFLYVNNNLIAQIEERASYII